MDKPQLVTVVGAVVNTCLAALKVIGGIVAGSSALVADGVHSLSDLGTDLAVVLGLRVAQRPPDDNHAYGHGRFETVAAFLVGAILVAAAVGMGQHAVERLLNALSGTVLAAPGIAAVVIAAVSIVTKELMFRWTRSVGRSCGSPAIIANAWHQRSDALSSVATVIGVGGAILLGPQWRILDPIAAVVVSVMVGWVGVKVALSALGEMTDRSLPQDECDAIKRIVASVHGAVDPHNIKTRRLGSDVSIEVHFRVDGEISVNSGHEIASEVERRIKERFGTTSTVITHVEPTFPGCADY